MRHEYKFASVITILAVGCYSGRVDSRLPDALLLRVDAGAGNDDADAADAFADAALSLTDQDAPSVRDPLRVLFIGNSYTEMNDLPAVVRALGAATPGADVEVESILAGGSYLGEHWRRPGTRERIATRRFGAVVLQGQSTETISGPASFLGYAQQFGDAVGGAGARSVWFSTWARRADNTFYPRNGFGIRTPEEMSESIESRYRTAADRSLGVLARVGAAWQRALAELPGVALHAEDGSHPTSEGTLLTACVMLQALTGKTPHVPDPAPLGVPIATARALCALAPHVECVGAEIQTVPWSPWISDHLACASENEQNVAPSLRCNAAAHEFCASQGCYASGFGPVSRGMSAAMLGCVSGEVLTTTFDELNPLHEVMCDRGNDGVEARCSTAIHRHCVSRGAVAGFGPVHVSGDELTVTCVRRATVVHTTFAALASADPQCDGARERWGRACSNAAWNQCRWMGHVAGFGPVETSGSNADIVCVDE